MLLAKLGYWQFADKFLEFSFQMMRLEAISFCIYFKVYFLNSLWLLRINFTHSFTH